LEARLVTAGRTITEADIINFAGLAGDYTQIHTNAEYCKTTPFGQRVAHGLLIISVISGLGAQTGIMEGTVLAFREITGWKFVKPVFIGDTIHGEMEVKDTKYLRRISGGSVILSVAVKNQDDILVMKGDWNLLFVSKPQLN